VTSLYDFSVGPKNCNDTWLPSSLITEYSPRQDTSDPRHFGILPTTIRTYRH